MFEPSPPRKNYISRHVYLDGTREQTANLWGSRGYDILDRKAYRPVSGLTRKLVSLAFP